MMRGSFVHANMGALRIIPPVDPNTTLDGIMVIRYGCSMRLYNKYVNGGDQSSRIISLSHLLEIPLIEQLGRLLSRKWSLSQLFVHQA